ncbi:DUF4231 domain-containing protein [Micromonospora chalcea]
MGMATHVAEAARGMNGVVVTVVDDSAVAEVWDRQSVWSQTANRMKVSIGRFRTVSLALTVGGAVVATVASMAGVPRAVASVLVVVAAVAVGLLPVLRPRWSGPVLQDWTRARSVSEALKSEVYLYLARAGDYAGSDREALLGTSTDTVSSDASDLLRYTSGIKPARRDLPPVTDHGSYLKVRVAGQADGYYRLRAAQLQARLSWFRRTELALAVAGVVFGALAARFPGWGLGGWIAVVTTVTAAVAAHVAAARYDYQLVEYLRTADELARLRRAASRTTSPAELDDLVVRCERVISIQNEGWMAKLATQPEAEPTG